MSQHLDELQSTLAHLEEELEAHSKTETTITSQIRAYRDYPEDQNRRDEYWLTAACIARGHHQQAQKDIRQKIKTIKSEIFLQKKKDKQKLREESLKERAALFAEVTPEYRDEVRSAFQASDLQKDPVARLLYAIFENTEIFLLASEHAAFSEKELERLKTNLRVQFVEVSDKLLKK